MKQNKMEKLLHLTQSLYGSNILKGVGQTVELQINSFVKYFEEG